MNCRILPLLLFILIAGCARDFNVRSARYSDDVYPPTTSVEVLDNFPTRAYTKIADLKINANQSEPILALKDRAMKLGANALVLQNEETNGAFAAPIGNTLFVGRIAIKNAVAIRYK